LQGAKDVVILRPILHKNQIEMGSGEEKEGNSKHKRKI
jgi:hypothetical protein